jgi:Fe-S-cluster containining protein
MVTAEVSLESGDWQLQCRMSVPAGPSTTEDLLPLARSLSDAVVGETVKAVERAGESISCKAGCGACCRNLVAISEVEARRIAKVVAEMPEPRRTQVLERFAAGRQQLDRAGLLRRLRYNDKLTDDDYLKLCIDYFEQGVACPFLENESCGIYAERPITCREYLVTSPAEYCSSPKTEPVRRVKIPLPVFNAVARWRVPPTAHHWERWVPLILAPDWAEKHPDTATPQPGVDLLRELLDHLTGKREKSGSTAAKAT